MSLPKLIYWFSTILLSLLLLFSTSMYLFDHNAVELTFKVLGYPTYLIYPLAFLKVLAVVAIVSSKYRFLKNLAYAGLFYNFSLALVAHIAVADGAGFLAILGLLLLGTSYLFDKIVRPRNKSAFNV